MSQADVPLILTAMPDHAKAQLFDLCSDDAAPVLAPTLDAALEGIETTLLTAHRHDTSSAFTTLVDALMPLAALAGPVQKLNCGADLRLIETAASSRELFLLIEGNLRAEVTTADGKRLRVARFLPGAIVGELAYYADGPRTADILTETPAKLLRLDLEKLAQVDSALAGQVHFLVAQVLARRLVNTTALLRNAGL